MKLHANITFHTPAGDKTGSYSRLWISSSMWRDEITTPDYSEVLLEHQGRTSKLQNPKQAPNYVWDFERALSAILPKTDAAQLNYLSVEHATYPTKSESVGSISLSCVYISSGGKTFQRGCFDPTTGLLQFVNEANQTYTFSNYIPFAGKLFPQRIRLFSNQTLVAEAELSAEAVDKVDPTALSALSGAEEKERPPKKTCSGPVIPGQVVRQVQPAYPSAAKANHESGTVSVLAVIDESGNVVRTEVVHSASPTLDSAALDAAQQWQYTPFTQCGEPMQTEVTLNFAF